MKNKRNWLWVVIAVLAVMAFLSLRNYNQSRVKVNDPANLAQVPYTFRGEKDGFAIAMEVRKITQADLKLLGSMPKNMTEEQVLQGFRSSIFMAYAGDLAIKELKYTFGNKTQWGFSGTLKAKEGEASMGQYLTGKDNLGGAFYSLDAKIGGPLPPMSQEFAFAIEAVKADGQKVQVQMTLKGVKGTAFAEQSTAGSSAVGQSGK